MSSFPANQLSSLQQAKSISPMERKTEVIKLKEYEDVYFKMERVINNCDTIPQLEMFGDSLIEIFRKKKFKRDEISKKEQERMTYQLIEAVRKKKQSVRFRNHQEKKEKE